MRKINLPPDKRKYVIKYGLLAILVSLVGLTTYLIIYINTHELVAPAASDVTTEPNINNPNSGKVVIFADTQADSNMHTLVVDEIYKQNPVAIFHLGDAVTDGNSAEQWQVFNNIESKLINNYNFYIAAGNHDQESALYYDNFSLPGNEKWYSVNYLGVHWIVLNSNLDIMPGSEQYAWLQDDLARTREKNEYTAVVLHQSFYTSSFHYQDNIPYRHDLIELFAGHGVDIVISGHSHIYERALSGGIYYLTCSSAGGGLRDAEYTDPAIQKSVKSYNYCVVENQNGLLTLKAYNENSEQIDSLIINKSN